MKITTWISVTTTVTNPGDAQKIIEDLLYQKLVACAQLETAMTNHYWREDSIDYVTEYRIRFTTHSDCFQELVAIVQKYHKYEVAEVIATDMVQISPDYETWLHEVVCIPGLNRLKKNKEM